MTKTANKMSEEQMVHLVRNALLAAGQEMGDGDQWPIVKDTVYKLMKDFEDLKVERNVDEELRKGLYAQIAEMEAGAKESSPEARAILEPAIREWKEVCDAYFSDLDNGTIYYDPENAPDHIKRMKAILATMEEDNG